MTKKEVLTDALRKAGVNGTIYDSLKRMSEDAGTYYAGILRGTDKPVRAKSKKTYQDKEGVTVVRKKLYDVETVYTVVIAEYDEEHMEQLVEAFLCALPTGYDDGDANWVSVEAGTVDWVDEKDSILKARLAVEIPVTFRYGVYEDIPAGGFPGVAEMETQRG